MTITVETIPSKNKESETNSQILFAMSGWWQLLLGVFWDVMPYSLAGGYPTFKDTCHLKLQGKKSTQHEQWFTIKHQYSSHMVARFYQTT